MLAARLRKFYSNSRRNQQLIGEVLEDHIRFHLTDGVKRQIARELAEDLIELVRAYLK